MQDLKLDDPPGPLVQTPSRAGGTLSDTDGRQNHISHGRLVVVSFAEHGGVFVGSASFKLRFGIVCCCKGGVAYSFVHCGAPAIIPELLRNAYQMYIPDLALSVSILYPRFRSWSESLYINMQFGAGVYAMCIAAFAQLSSTVHP
jgi:hypothetical protein